MLQIKLPKVQANRVHKSDFNMKTPIQQFKRRLNQQDLLTIEQKVKAALLGVRNNMLAPELVKKPPLFSLSQVGELCNLGDSAMQHRMSKGDLPPPLEPQPGKKKRPFTLASTRTWTRTLRSANMRPENVDAKVIATCNFKGGVSKTTSTATLAQGLSLRGHKVLVVDMDPQASLTTLFGIDSSKVEDDQTLLQLCYGNKSFVDYAIRQTYWDGIDIIPASLSLYGAEFALPNLQKTKSGFEFWNLLTFGLDSVRREYDVILIDTSPSLSYLTINALLAADGLVMPVPPNNLDFASSAQFWSLFNDVMTTLLTKRGKAKEFDFVSILLSKVETGLSSIAVREWITGAYGETVLPVEIPLTSATSGASMSFGTVYDTSAAEIGARTYKRAFDAYEKFVELIEGQIQIAWGRQLSELES